jgi:shikimate dehydrogenase
MKIDYKTKIYGLVGHPLEHTASPAIHNAAFEALGLNAVYLVFDIEPTVFEDAIKGLKALKVCGFNVTIPYKERIIQLLTHLDPSAAKVGAVNTVKLDGDSLLGYNTDVIGFLAPLLELDLKLNEMTALILGAGGAAKACVRALLEAGCREVIVLNRSIERALNLSKQHNTKLKVGHLNEESLKEALSRASLVVNATPVGMYPNVDESIIPKALLRSDLIVYDLVYRPTQTKLLKEAKEAGATTISGYKMLLEQAAESFSIWTGLEPPKEAMLKALKMELGVEDVG